MMANIESILQLARPKNLSTDVENIIGEFVSLVFKISDSSTIGIRLAALFDLVVSCQYYSCLANKGWTYCNSGSPQMFYPYTNACPRCLGEGEFIYTKANKPGSGKIGMITTEMLCQMLIEIFKHQGHKVQIYKASEPIDVIIYEPETTTMVIAEVKAAPLITIPLSVDCETLTEEIDGVLIPANHTICDNPFIKNSPLNLYFPKTKNLSEKYFPIPIDWNKEEPFFHAILSLSKDNSSFLPYYFSFWEDAYLSYSTKVKDNTIFWLTNACGSPTPRPESWPRRRGEGYETISDAKTSVGMDRTDDIKKGIYQVLKLGAEFKPKYPNVKTALISNIHAIRHHEEYLRSIQDIIWTIDETRQVSEWAELPPNTPLYNLFDGIISFTSSDIRDVYLKTLFSFTQR